MYCFYADACVVEITEGNKVHQEAETHLRLSHTYMVEPYTYMMKSYTYMVDSFRKKHLQPLPCLKCLTSRDTFRIFSNS